MTALDRLAVLLAPSEEDEQPPARRSRRDWLVDAALFLLTIPFGIGALTSSIDQGLDGPLLVLDVLLGVTLSLSLWWRRRWPLALALISAALVPFSAYGGFASVVLLCTVAIYRRWQLTVLVWGLHLALLPAERAVHPSGDSTVSYYITGVLGTAAFTAFGLFLRGRRQARRERLRRTEAEEQLHTEQVRYAERERIAREMHDVLAHRISLLSLHAGALEFRPDAPPEEIARAAAVIRASAHQALEDLRAVIGVLRDGPDSEAPQPPQPTLAALPGLLEESRAAGMLLHAEIRLADLAAVPDAIGRHALRIVQETLTNARKHATSAAVDLLV